MHRMCQRLVAVDFRQFVGHQHRTLTRRKGLVTQKHSASMFASYSGRRMADSTEADSAQNSQSSTEKLSFTIKKPNGSRMSGDEFLSTVNDTIAKSGGASAENSAQSAIPRAAFDVLLSEYNSLLEETSAFKDRYTRALADTENVRKRGQRLTEEAKSYAIQGFCKDLLEIPDILETAINSVPADELKSSKALKNLYDGVSMTRSMLLKTFAKHGLQPVSPEGEKFDPNLHEALFEIPRADAKHEAGHVGHVATIGYSLHGRPIRPAKVGVVKGS